MSLTKCELKAVLDKLTSERPDEGWDRTTWTLKVKEALVRFGLAKGHKTCARDVAKTTGNTWGEWLYDVVWLKATCNFDVCDVPLVAEIEWGNTGEVWDDFQKLPIARARVRVLIIDDVSGLLEKLQTFVESFALSEKGDKYLFATYTYATRRFEVTEYVCRKGVGSAE